MKSWKLQEVDGLGGNSFEWNNLAQKSKCLISLYVDPGFRSSVLFIQPRIHIEVEKLGKGHGMGCIKGADIEHR